MGAYYLSGESEAIEKFIEKYVLPYVENKFGIKSKRLILKYFGDVKALESVLDKAKTNCADAIINCVTVNGDTSVDVLFKDGTDKEKRIEFTRTLVGELKDNIYAEFDTTLSERLFDLLKLTHSIVF